MQKALCAMGAVVGLIASFVLAGSYEESGLLYRAWTAWVMFGTAVCVYGFFLPMLQERDKRREP